MVDTVERLVYSVPECARALGLSRSNAYDLVQQGILPSVRIRGRVLVPKKSLFSLLDKQTTNT